MLNGLQINHFTVQILQCTLLITSTSSNEIKVRSDANIITSLLERIMKSYIESNQIIVDKPWRRFEKDINTNNRKTAIENAIRLTVIKLKPILKDSEHNNNVNIETDNSIKLEGSDETTIVELNVNGKADTRKTKELTDTFQRKINKYKLLRHNITKLLGTVKTDNSTKKLITRTLDEILALLIERQCPLNNHATGDAMNQLLKDSRKTIESIQKIGKEGLASLREGYWEPFKGFEIHDQSNGPQKNMEDMKRLVYQILINSWSVVDQYRLSCFLKRKNKAVDTGDRDCPGRNCHRTAQLRAFSNNLDRDSKTKDTNQCDGFYVCTDELRMYLTKTYKSLNDTAVATFSNYAAMYMRDVKTETKIDDDNIVSRELKNLRVSAEIKVHKIFMDEMENFTQDALKTKKEVSIQLISNVIRGIIGQIKSSLHMLVWEQFSKKAKLFLTIKDDLILNLRVDMDNLNQQIYDTICGSFVLCNGKPNGNGTRRFYNRSPKKDVYVQLEISLDDRVKDSIARFSQQNRKSLQGLKNMTYGLGKSLINAIDRRRYSLVNITRTTVGSSATTEGSRENGLAEPFF